MVVAIKTFRPHKPLTALERMMLRLLYTTRTRTPRFFNDDPDIAQWLTRRYPQHPLAQLRLPWGVWLAFARRYPQSVRNRAAEGSMLAQQLVAHIDAEAVRVVLREKSSDIT